MTLEQAIGEIEDEFAFLEDWEERYRHVIEMGRAMAPLPDAAKTETARVRGCASQVWVRVTEEPGGRLLIEGDSDAHIVRGLVALMIRIFSNRTPSEIVSVDAEGLLSRLGLGEALTAQRSNGLRALLARIHAEALERASRT